VRGPDVIAGAGALPGLLAGAVAVRLRAAGGAEVTAEDATSAILGLAELRRAVTAAEYRLRVQERRCEALEALVEQRAYEEAARGRPPDAKGHPLGANAEDRERALALALRADAEYQRAVTVADSLRAEAAELKTELQIVIDGQDLVRRSGRNALAVALLLQAGVSVRIKDSGEIVLPVGELLAPEEMG